MRKNTQIRIYRSPQIFYIIQWNTFYSIFHSFQRGSRHTSNMMFQPIYSKMCTASFYTTVTIVNKTSFEKMMCVIIKKMMHYAVAKICSKHLAHFRVVYNKTVRWLRFIGS